MERYKRDNHVMNEEEYKKRQEEYRGSAIDYINSRYTQKVKSILNLGKVAEICAIASDPQYGLLAGSLITSIKIEIEELKEDIVGLFGLAEEAGKRAYDIVSDLQAALSNDIAYTEMMLSRLEESYIKYYGGAPRGLNNLNAPDKPLKHSYGTEKNN